MAGIRNTDKKTSLWERWLGAFIFAYPPDGFDPVYHTLYGDKMIDRNGKLYLYSPITLITSFLGLPNAVKKGSKQSITNIIRNFFGINNDASFIRNSLRAVIFLPWHVISTPVFFVINVIKIFTELLPNVVVATCDYFSSKINGSTFFGKSGKFFLASIETVARGIGHLGRLITSYDKESCFVAKKSASMGVKLRRTKTNNNNKKISTKNKAEWFDVEVTDNSEGKNIKPGSGFSDALTDNKGNDNSESGSAAVDASRSNGKKIDRTTTSIPKFVNIPGMTDRINPDYLQQFSQFKITPPSCNKNTISQNNKKKNSIFNLKK